MSVIIIITGGHKALEDLQHKSVSMTPQQRETAKALVEKFVQDVQALIASTD